MRINSPVSRIARTRRGLRRGWTAFNEGDLLPLPSKSADPSSPRWRSLIPTSLIAGKSWCRPWSSSAAFVVNWATFRRPLALHERALRGLVRGLRSAPDEYLAGRAAGDGRLAPAGRSPPAARPATARPRVITAGPWTSPTSSIHPTPCWSQRLITGSASSTKTPSATRKPLTSTRDALAIAECEAGAEAPELADLHDNLAGLQTRPGTTSAPVSPYGRRALDAADTSAGTGFHGRRG